MNSTTAIAALIGIAFAAATASSAFAQSSAPGSTPPKPNKVTAVPPPPPRGVDKYATRPPPPGPRDARPTGPKPVDDIAANPGGWVFSTCYPAAGPNCVPSLDKVCTKRGGGMSTNPDGSVTCTVYD